MALGGNKAVYGDELVIGYFWLKDFWWKMTLSMILIYIYRPMVQHDWILMADKTCCIILSHPPNGSCHELGKTTFLSGDSQVCVSRGMFFSDENPHLSEFAFNVHTIRSIRSIAWFWWLPWNRILPWMCPRVGRWLMLIMHSCVLSSDVRPRSLFFTGFVSQVLITEWANQMLNNFEQMTYYSIL